MSLKAVNCVLKSRVRSDKGSGCSDFEVTGLTATSDRPAESVSAVYPRDFTDIRPADLTDPEDPETRIRWDLISDMDIGSGGPISGIAMITRVAATANDTFRALWLNGSRHPVLVVGSSDRAYTELDPGRFIQVTKDSVWAVSASRGLSTVRYYGDQDRIPDMTPYMLGDERLRDMSAKIRADFADGKLDVLACGDYMAEGSTLRYSDTRLEFPGRDVLLAVCSRTGNGTEVPSEYGLDRHAASALVRKIRGGSPDGSITAVEYSLAVLMLAPECDSMELRVNGVPVVHKTMTSKGSSELHYVNGYKISRDDLADVLANSLCHQGHPETYDRYLRTVSKISLKYYRLMRNGMPASFSSQELRPFSSENPDDDGGDSCATIGGHSSGSSIVTANLPFRKEFGSLPEVEFAGAWRKIAKLDVLVNRLSSRSYRRGYRRRGISARYAGGDVSMHLNQDSSSMHLLDGTDIVHHMDILQSLILINDCFAEQSRLPIRQEWFARAEHWPRGLQLKRVHADNAMAVVRTTGTIIARAFSTLLLAERERIRKSKELLGEVMQRTGAVRTDKGFQVKGLSGAVYTIDHDTARVSCGDQHICIVTATEDKSGYDYIAGVISALARDTLTVRKIDTLKRTVAEHTGQAA